MYYYVLLCTTGYYRVLLCTAGYYYVLVTMYYYVLLNTTVQCCVLLSTTEYYYVLHWVLLCTTKYYCKLPTETFLNSKAVRALRGLLCKICPIRAIFIPSKGGALQRPRAQLKTPPLKTPPSVGTACYNDYYVLVIMCPYYCVLLRTTEYYWILLCTTVYYYVLLNTAESYFVGCPGTARFLM